MKKTTPALAKELKRILPVAKKAALEAGLFIDSKFGKFKNLKLKADASLVTEVDRKSEDMVKKILLSKFPSHEVLGEETGLRTDGSNTKSPFRWHIDPLDGTTNFVHGFPFFCVSIGLEFEEMGPVLGVIYHPLTENMYWAAKGTGAFQNKKAIHVSKTKNLKDALLSTGFSMRRDEHLTFEIDSFQRMVKGSHAIRRTGSAALDLTFVATGQFDGFWERGLNSWDVAAAITIVREAGGMVSQNDGATHALQSKTIVATNSLIHREIIRTLTG